VTWPLNTFWTAYLGLGLVATVLELVRPAHKVKYMKWEALPLDVIACVIYQAVVYPVAFYLTTYYVLDPRFVVDIPIAARVVAYYLLADLGSYWFHRLMHTRHVWRVHRFHHSPTQLYWLAGVRSTLPQQILFNAPYILVGPLLTGAPPWLLTAILVEGIARNHWQHMNFAWRSNWLEWIIVTPRYHHIHHSANAAQHDGNYGSLFTIWDRLFGTFVDPDLAQVKKFGTGEQKRDPVLLMIGV
jgi:sterol desaturase/sphingolipid hydroxylase (fatty acid hydroxylase superfamily)